MKICFAVSAMESGGAERVVSTLSNELSNRGYDVTIVMVSATFKKCYYELNTDVKLIALCENALKASNPFKRVKELRRFILNENPDVVIAFLPHVCVYTWLALKNSNIPYILSERNDPNQYSFIYKVLIRKAFSKANACVFQTHDALKWYRNVQKDTDKVIYNIVGLTYIPKIGSNVNKKKSVLFVGRLDPQKNYVMLLRVFKRFLNNNPDYILDVYGDGPDREQFLELIKALKLRESVVYHGKSSSWHEDEYNAGMFVSTSDYEGMSNSLEEAATLGIPCVATNCPIGGSAELASIFDNIFLCNVGDENAFLNGMQLAIENNCSFDGINKGVAKETIINEWINLLEKVGRK